MESKYFSTKPPHIYAHRGGGAHFPENTLAAFENAAKHTSYFELDVWLSQDQEAIVHHDPSLLRTFGIDKNVSDLTLKELKEHSPNIPTLEEVTSQFTEQFFTIELKHLHDNISRKVLEVLNKTNALDRSLIASENALIMDQIRQTFPSFVPTSMSLADGQEFFAWVQSGCISNYQPKAQAVQAPVEIHGLRLDQKEIVTAAHALGIQIHYWTINDPLEMTRLLELGADAIITDDPELGALQLRKFLEQ